MIDKELLKGSISLMVLEFLSHKDMYGYEIIKEFETRSENVFSFKEGTLYPLLHTLEKNDDIYSYWETTSSQRKRKYYHITDKGKKELASRKSQWLVFTEKVNKIISNEGQLQFFTLAAIN